MSLILDGTAGVTFPNSTIQASAGNVLQVVNAAYSTQTSSSSSTYADTGITASITPKFSTSKILVLVSINGQEKSSDTYAQFKLLRGASLISLIEYEAGYNSLVTVNAIGSTSIEYLDSPATTSATTYKVQFASGANTAQVRICVSSSTSTITLMEIAA